jgi:hypothetical protein
LAPQNNRFDEAGSTARDEVGALLAGVGGDPMRRAALELQRAHVRAETSF